MLSEVILCLFIFGLSYTADLNRCRGRSPGNGISISNATCYLDGRVEYIARVHIVIDGFMVTYNCTVGETTKEGVSFGWAYNRDIEPGHFDIERWNYTNSICFISGCYAIKSYPFSTYVISGTACTVLVPLSLNSQSTMEPIPAIFPTMSYSMSSSTSTMSSSTSTMSSSVANISLWSIPTVANFTEKDQQTRNLTSAVSPTCTMSSSVANVTLWSNVTETLQPSCPPTVINFMKKNQQTRNMVFIIMASLLTMVMLVSIIILVIIRSRNYKKENYVVEVWTMGEEEDQIKQELDISIGNTKSCRESLVTITEALRMKEDDYSSQEDINHEDKILQHYPRKHFYPSSQEDINDEDIILHHCPITHFYPSSQEDINDEDILHHYLRTHFHPSTETSGQTDYVLMVDKRFPIPGYNDVEDFEPNITTELSWDEENFFRAKMDSEPMPVNIDQRQKRSEVVPIPQSLQHSYEYSSDELTTDSICHSTSDSLSGYMDIEIGDDNHISNNYKFV